MVLSAAQQAFYRDNGYLIVENVLSGERVTAVRAALEDRLVYEGARAGSEGSVNPGVRRLCNLLGKGRAFEALAVEPIVLEMARLTIGSSPRWQAMNFHDPLPGEASAHQGIHADRAFFPNCHAYLNVCWAIDAMTEENGATRIVPGSHKSPWPRDVLSETQTRAPIEGELYAVCAAGAAVFVNGDTWHGGRANYSNAPRRVIHLGFACQHTAPQYGIAESLTPDVRARLGAHCALIPGTLDSFGLAAAPYAGRDIDKLTDDPDGGRAASGNRLRARSP